MWEATMSLTHRFNERIGDARAHADHCRLFDAKPDGDRISRLETDAADVACQPVRVLSHDLHGVYAIGLVDPNGSCCPNTVAMQEDHDLADNLLLRPSAHDPLGTHGPNSLDLTKPIGVSLDNVEHLSAEGFDHLLGVDGPDAADHPGGKIFLDALDRTRCRGAHETRLELLAMGAVVDPFAGGRQPLSSGDGGGVADDGHEIAVRARLDARQRTRWTAPAITSRSG